MRQILTVVGALTPIAAGRTLAGRLRQEPRSCSTASSAQAKRAMRAAGRSIAESSLPHFTILVQEYRGDAMTLQHVDLYGLLRSKSPTSRSTI